MEVWQMYVLGLLFLILTVYCLVKTIQSFRRKKTIVTKIVLVMMTLFFGFLAFYFLFATVLLDVFSTLIFEMLGGIFKADYWNGN
ncbi:MAG: hypothetical protein R2775_03465 [Flavobacteriaceae bacterium]